MRKFLLLNFLFICYLVNAQPRQLSGRVTSETDPEGLPGVNVVIKGTTQGTITDLNGNYTLSVDEGVTIIFSFVGYQTREILYTGQPTLDIILVEEPRELSEIVVVGYSSVQKRDITGSVATVKGDVMKEMSISGLDQGLQGQAAGVQVTQSSGTPGGGVKVHIRGPSSIQASNTPLYIVDGIPVETGALGGREFGGQNDNALSLLNPNDYESYTILKDASAVALYGSRGSNGVVIITTKKGKAGKPKITADIQRGIIDPVKKVELLNSTQLLELQREAVSNGGGNPDALGLIPGVTDAVDTDWLDETTRRAIMQQYQLSVSGGNDFTKYYLSGSYRDEEGVQLNNKFQRMSATINLEQKLSEKLSFGTNISLSRGFNKRVKGDNFLDGVYSGAIKSLPYYSPYDENGNLVGPESPAYPSFPNFNPVAQAVVPRFNTLSVKILGNINGTYQINKNLKAVAKVALDFNDVTEDQYESSQTAIGGFLPSVGGQGYGIFIANTSSRVVSYATLSYDKEISKDKFISAVAGTEILREHSIGGSVQGRLFPSDDFSYIGSAGIIDDGSSGKSPIHSILSYFAEGRLNYEDRFLFTASFRADGSSNFGPNNKFGYFPAASAAWRVSNEKFFRSDLINDLKLRASFGFTGNERIGGFLYLATWGTATYNGSSGVGPNNTDNPDIKWESKREINAGVDVALLNGRIQTSIDAYYNKSFDLLMTRPFPLTTGFGGRIANIGDMENKGIDFTATSVNFDATKFSWRTTVNLSKNLNKVLFLADSIPLYAGFSGNGVDGTNIIKVGQPLGTFWGLNFLGVDPATGDAIYEDRNEDGTINNDDAMVIGSAQPDLIGGITNNLKYKNFDLSIFFQFSLGNEVLNFSKSTLVNMGADLLDNQSIEALKRWRKPGDITDVPRYDETRAIQNNLHSNNLLEDGSYVRLKNLNFGFTLPTQMSNRLMMEQLRVYISATNLWTYTRYSGADPEVSSRDGSTASQAIDFFTFPQVRTISAGLTATFR
jgi:TonB-dependent starch-binding outer membrane protein SusC